VELPEAAGAGKSCSDRGAGILTRNGQHLDRGRPGGRLRLGLDHLGRGASAQKSAITMPSAAEPVQRWSATPGAVRDHRCLFYASPSRDQVSPRDATGRPTPSMSRARSGRGLSITKEADNAVRTDVCESGHHRQDSSEPLPSPSARPLHFNLSSPTSSIPSGCPFTLFQNGCSARLNNELTTRKAFAGRTSPAVRNRSAMLFGSARRQPGGMQHLPEGHSRKSQAANFKLGFLGPKEASDDHPWERISHPG